ncbi:phage tail spike protein [Clostridium gasigenes]|uniref:phage tail spike protein n=1 Tax=Clostridium gasigenes TaxID=94869 RepID=UPI001C0E006A|nr:phage tail spike protein [Clostridium gasigenes]MBU3103003.1 phage tail protein [Clostridium gasigenes]
MLQLYDLNKVKIAGLKNYKDYCIESNLSNGDKKLSFLYPLKESQGIVAEGYVQTRTAEFVIKELGTAGEWKTIKAILNTEDLEGNVFEHFDTTNKTINESITLALAGTGWTVGTCNVSRRRTVRKTNSSSWEIIQEAKKNYRAELEFDTLNKKINIFEKRGTDKGTYFIESLNLKDLDVQSNSYDFYTRIMAIGKDDLRVTLENYQYSNKKKTYIWSDDRYTDLISLTEDAMSKLNELSKPYRAYSANIIDLAIMNAEYKDILTYKLGDTITLISKDKEIKEKQRIVKIVEYPEEPERNTCEIANTTLKFEDLQKEFQDTSSTVNNITVDDGTIDGNAINGISSKKIYDFEANVMRVTDITIVNAKIENLYAEKADIGSLNAVLANIGTLNATKANITDLKAINVSITNLKADKANITDLTVINGRINVLEVNTGNIQTLLAGNLTAINMQAGGITSDKLTIQNGFIKNAMIDTVDVSKINAGIINTNKFTIKSADGGIEIVGATQQFKDKNGKVRIQMGKDTQGNFNFILRGEDGVTALIDHTGIKRDAIADDLIVKEMIGSKAVGEKQLDYTSFSEGFNKDTNTTTLKATKIKLDNQNQTLDVAFNGLKSQADGTKNLTESHTTSIGVQQGKIDTLISDTSIVKDGVTTKLKDEYSKTVATVNSSVETIGKHTTLLDAHTGDIKKVTTDVVEVNKSLDGITQSVSASTTKISDMNKSVSTANSEIVQLKKSIVLKVEQTDVNTAKSQAIMEAVGTKDTRSTNQNPEWYFTNYPKRTVNEFKFANIIGIPGEGSVYGTCITAVPWDSSSGGYPVQTFTSYGTSTFERSGTSNTAWSAWKQIEDIAGSQAKANAAQTNAVTITETKINQAKADIKIETNSIKASVSSVDSKITTIDEKVTAQDTRLKTAEQKITDNAIISTVSSNFYNKNQTDNNFANKTQLTQLDDKLEFQITNSGSSNLISNSSFDAGFAQWSKHGLPILSTNTSFLLDRYGQMVSIESPGGGEGIYQRFSTIPGEFYTVSFYAESNNQLPLHTSIGIEGINVITLKIEPGFKRWSFTFKATLKEHTFMAYLGQSGKFYLGRVMVTKGTILQEYREGTGVYSNTVSFSRDGMVVDSSNTNTKTITDSGGFRIQDKATGQNLLEANTKGVSAKGGRFYVDGANGNYTLLWGRDININGGRAIVGTNSKPESSLIANKLYLNYNNDFINGVEIGGKLTNNTFPILSTLGLVLDSNGYLELDNGFIIQYGKVTGLMIQGGNVCDSSIRYKKRFPHGCISFMASIDTVDGDNWLATNYTSISRTNGAEAGWFYAKNNTGDKKGALMDVNYIAIGY